ncbi:MAG: VTT domain-containing protein [Candidatus Odinarchaeum yellowstonii]|uniref:Undecaprenyl-diphosphatase n=1 Tax=Odinarchaeota yellowstonii (strain LCB_4) TaxID=1841599 RepID=A0AAF0ICA0_ODILC|nr:MAG: VTT domain-containing protein [Candidatus Odinarchaeum yellowstonii]
MWFLLVLALVQGLLEWLPVSSQGQIAILLQALSGLEPSTIFSITIWLHLGTLIAVLLYYRKDYFKVLRPVGFEEKQIRTFLIIATLSTGIAALPAYIFLKEVFPFILGDFLTLLTGFLLILTGVIIYLTRRKTGLKGVTGLSLTDAFLVGLIQGFAILPGLSRSGLTIAMLLWLGYKNSTSLKLSFMLSAPAVTGALLVDAISNTTLIFNLPVHILILAFIITGVIGFLTIKYLTQFSQRVNFSYFCIILGLLVILILLPLTLLGGSLNIIGVIGEGITWIYNMLRNIVVLIGPAGLFAVMIVQAVLAPIPSEGILILAGGAFSLSYGFPTGMLIAVLVSGLGGIAGAVLSYSISKFGGRPVVKRLVSEKTLESADEWFKKYGGWAVLIGRLLPFIPFDAISYGAGLTKMRTTSFILATVLGIFPRSLLYTYIGYLIENSLSTGSLELLYIIVTSILALAILLVFLYKYYFLMRHTRMNPVVNTANES